MPAAEHNAIMSSKSSLAVLTTDPNLSPALREIAHKVQHHQRITPEEGILLFEEGSLSFVGSLANYIREQRHGDNTYFNRNFHIEPTNLCVYDCKFCSYSRLIKQRKDESAWEYTMEDMMDIVRSYDGQPVTEVHIVGGVLPQYDLPFYLEFFKKIKAHRPELHVKALTPVEYHYIFKKAKVSYEDGMRMVATGEAAHYPMLTRKSASKLPLTNAPASNGCASTKSGTNWAAAPTPPCSTATSSGTNIAWIIWSSCGNCKTKPAASRPSSRSNSAIRTTK